MSTDALGLIHTAFLPPYGYAYFHVGYMLDAFFLGVVLCQFSVWKVRQENKEPWLQRALVYYLTIGALLNSGFLQACGMTLFVRTFGQATVVDLGPWSQGACAFEIGLAMPVEALFTHRAYQLWDRPRWMAFTFPVIFLASIGIGITNIVLNPTGFIAISTGPLFISWAISLLVIDWVVSALIIVALARKKSGLHRSDKLVMRMIILSAEAQLVPSAVAAGLIIKAFVAPTSLLTMTFIAVPKIWVISAMLAINFRQTYRQELEQERERRQNTLDFINPDIVHPAPDGRNNRQHSSGGTNTSGIFVPTLSILADQETDQDQDNRWQSKSLPNPIDKGGEKGDIFDIRPLPVSSTSFTYPDLPPNQTSTAPPLRVEVDLSPTSSQVSASGGGGGRGLSYSRSSSHSEPRRPRTILGYRRPSIQTPDERDHLGEMSFEEMLALKT